jgi:hypothetical protein
MESTGGRWNVLDNPRWVTPLFSSTELAWVWLIARVYIGWGWLHAGRLGLAGERPTSKGQMVEQWLRILVGVGLALFALIALSGLLQMMILLVAGFIVAIAGLGMFPLVRKAADRPAGVASGLTSYSYSSAVPSHLRWSLYLSLHPLRLLPQGFLVFQGKLGKVQAPLPG